MAADQRKAKFAVRFPRLLCQPGSKEPGSTLEMLRLQAEHVHSSLSAHTMHIKQAAGKLRESSADNAAV